MYNLNCVCGTVGEEILRSATKSLIYFVQEQVGHGLFGP